MTASSRRARRGQVASLHSRGAARPCPAPGRTPRLDALDFPDDLRVGVPSVRHDRPYHLVRADLVVPTARRVLEMEVLANEPQLYDALYRRHLHGAPVPPERAAQFLGWAADTWRGDTHFAFLLLDPDDRLAGSIVMKSRDRSGVEIGYWLSARHAGVMTNAVLALAHAARHAGCAALWARVRDGNARSEAVLARAGFVTLGVAPDPEKGNALFSRYRLDLNPHP